MKIDFDSNVQQTKTELDEKFFSIADPAFIFDLLRNKIYSNPIAAVCRELTCNALDAHREVGSGLVPIVVNLPNYDEPYFKVKDFGPGISPNRMDDIYLKYAASTKRNTNDQIGAFGIGAKSPFSYSDSFTIVTNHNGKCYNYAAFIDESRIGKLILLSETDTADPNGTEIIVPVKAGDFHTFNTSVEKCTRHWQVKPKFTGSTIEYKTVGSVINTDKWFVSSVRESYYEQKIKVLVGEIEYSLESVSVKGFADISILSLVQSDLYLKFQVGEVSLAANRESIFLDPQTKQKISERLALVREEFVSIIQSRVNSLPSLWEANCFVNSDLGNLCRDEKIIEQLTWNGAKITPSFTVDSGAYAVYEFSKSKSGRFSSTEKYNRRSVSRIVCRKDALITIHDCGTADPSTRHIKKFFEEDAGIRYLYVVCPSESGSADFDVDNFIESHNFGQLKYELLSKHNNVIKAKKQSDKVKFIISKYSLEGTFDMSNIADAKADTKQKLVVYLEKDSWRNNKRPIKKDKIEHISSRTLSALTKYRPEVSIYGVDKNIPESRIREVFPNLVFVDDYIEQAASEIGKEKIMEAMWAEKQSSAGMSNVARLLVDSKDKIENKNSTIYKFYEQRSLIKLKIKELNGVNDFVYNMGIRHQVSAEEYEKYCEAKPDLSNMWESVEKTYPLLGALQVYGSDRYVDNIIDYINLIDNNKK